MALTFGQRLASLRKHRNLSQYALAEQLDMSRGQIANYEQGQREPDFATVNRFAEFFNVSIDYLLGRSENTEKKSENSSKSEVDPEEAEFLRWVKEHLGPTFFYDFERDPEQNKRQLMQDLRYLYERDRKNREK